MSTPISSDVISIALAEESLALQKKQLKWESARAYLLPIVTQLITQGIEPRFCMGSLDINFTGDSAKLAAVLGIIHAAGYTTTAEPPALGTNEWYAFFYNPGQHEIWLNFTSSVCKRVKVGEKMVKQEIYEYQCGEFETTNVAVLNLEQLL